MKPLKYEVFNTSVDTDFWYILEKKKLEELRLNKIVNCYGFYQTGNQFTDMSSRFRITRESFFSEKELSVDWYTNVSPGRLIITNTKEEFKNTDKKLLIREAGEEILDNIKNKNWIVTPSILTKFQFLCFGDLKKHQFFYSLCFPSVKSKVEILEQSKLSSSDIDTFSKTYGEFKEKADLSNRSFFCINKKTFEVFSLKHIFDNQKSINLGDYYFGFNDSSSNVEFPGSVIRNYVFAIQSTFPEFKEKLSIIAVRQTHGSQLLSEKSILFSLKFEPFLNRENKIVFVGWEKRIRSRDISKLLDPLKLCENSVNLNLQLMKWRMFPSLNLEKLKDLKCLLVGSGTLGCHVSRNLLSWGIFNMTFIDRGNVSHSNPVRQPLYEFCDVGKNKALCAAEHIKRIYPNAITKGYNIDIPMPGHFISTSDSSVMKKTTESIALMRKLIEEHDVIFLLTDTRESRWLPTVIACSEKKIVINSALGFESFLIMRHGVRNEETKEEYKHLGCYFCNDVVAPVNSLKDRTLDQQCTVTRPGVSAIAGSICVELLMCLLHHRDGKYADTENDDESAFSELGHVPHQVRGTLSDYKTFTLTGKNYSQCIACSDCIVKKYEKEGDKFLIEVFNKPGVLEDITGLRELQEKTQKFLEESFLMDIDEEDDFSLV